MHTSLHLRPSRHSPVHCVGIALSDIGQAVVLRPTSLSDPELTDDEDLPWLAHRQNKPLIIDLKGVEQFSSDLARWFIHLTNLLPGKHFRLQNVSASVQAGIRLLGLDRLGNPESKECTFAY